MLFLDLYRAFKSMEPLYFDSPAETSIYIFYCLFIRQIPNPTTAGSARNNVKEREKKERQARRGENARGSGHRARNLLPQPGQVMRS